MSITRRELCLLLPAAVLPAALRLEGAAEQENALPSASFPFDKLPVKTMASGGQRRDVMKGKLATGESLEVHETTLPPGAMPHAAHHHVHSEMWLVREGTLELSVNGASYRLGPGGVGFVRSNEEHAVKNVGTTPANYFVVAIGPGAGSV
jgi:mannose-6-phosphate isomerase-like protein (cupin superfamily)